MNEVVICEYAQLLITFISYYFRCREMATLPAGYIPQRKVSSASISGSLDFIVCVQCCRMVDSVPIRHTLYYLYPIAHTVRRSADMGEMITPA